MVTTLVEAEGGGGNGRDIPPTITSPGDFEGDDSVSFRDRKTAEAIEQARLAGVAAVRVAGGPWRELLDEAFPGSTHDLAMFGHYVAEVAETTYPKG